jgi:hypothetical protein
MNRRDFVAAGTTLAAAAAVTDFANPLHAMPAPSTALSDMTDSSTRATRKILIAGGGFRTKFIGLMAQLSGKARPRILYLPTPAPTASRASSASTRAARRSTWSRSCSAASLPARRSCRIGMKYCSAPTASW